MGGAHLSTQGKASLRFFVNRVAVEAGYIYPYEKDNPGWRITPEGKEYSTLEDTATEEVSNVDTDESILIPSNSAKGAAFERYILELLKQIYPDYSWYHQGVHKNNERGLDLIGHLVGNNFNAPLVIGVQVKLHASHLRPTETEWLKFLAGCFCRGISKAIFITTGSLTSGQRREAGEAKILVIEGRGELDRIANRHSVPKFDLYDDV